MNNALTHIYQRTREGFLLFYSFVDYLVYFTIVCVVAPRYRIRILAMCQMSDHLHFGAIVERSRDLAAFMRDTSMWYSRYGQAPQIKRGILFNERHYGSAMKANEKKARSTIVYIGNNPVERKLVKRAENYQWNYLAYAISRHPFSEKLIIRKASKQLKKAIDEVKATYHLDQPLSYSQLWRLFSKLDNNERLQLIDFIITTYSVINYDEAIGFFGSYEKMIGAMYYNTGSEYDMKESFVGRSDTCYSEIATWLLNNLHLKDIHDVFRMEEEKRASLLLEIHRNIGVNPRQIAKFLRLIPDYRF
jgi:REP element-mobilizing transposase RayT